MIFRKKEVERIRQGYSQLVHLYLAFRLGRAQRVLGRIGADCRRKAFRG